ncbi:recombinase family protein [Streptomyces sp. NPDC001890]|uniref:recombinase family protein n=1 Tax=Streptomyces sp. NPDC001890 TaxID=3364620 RepID=UPI0036AF912D
MSRSKPTRGNPSASVAGEPAAVYCRISQADDDDQTGLDRQERICREIAERRGLVINPAHVFVDNSRSAWSRKRKRPGWDRLLNEARNPWLPARHRLPSRPAHAAAPGPGGAAPALRRPRDHPPRRGEPS